MKLADLALPAEAFLESTKLRFVSRARLLPQWRCEALQHVVVLGLSVNLFFARRVVDAFCCFECVLCVFRKAFELLKEVQNKGEKALVFSQFTTFLDVVEEALQLHMPTLRFCRLDGSTVVEERQRLVDGFNQTEECTAFLLSTKAGGQGLNLTAARTVILLDQVSNVI